MKLVESQLGRSSLIFEILLAIVAVIMFAIGCSLWNAVCWATQLIMHLDYSWSRP